MRWRIPVMLAFALLAGCPPGDSDPEPEPTPGDPGVAEVVSPAEPEDLDLSLIHI